MNASFLEPLEARVLMSIAPGDVPPAIFQTADGEVLRTQRVVDIDGDGALDVVALAGGSVYFVRGRGDGSFEPARQTRLRGLPDVFASSQSFFLYIGDFDGDGDTDVAVTGGAPNAAPSPRERTWRLLNTGGGVLAPSGMTRGSPFPGGNVADLDGVPGDELISGYTLYKFRYGRLEARGVFMQGLPEGRITGIFDPDLDGDDDLLLITRQTFGQPTRVLLVRNSGDGTFALEHIVEYEAFHEPGVSTRDLNGDHFEEIVLVRGAFAGWEREYFLSAVANHAGQFASEPTLLVGGTLDELRALGGHPPAAWTDSGFRSHGGVSIHAVRDETGDGRPDIIVSMFTEQYWADRPPMPVPYEPAEWHDVHWFRLEAAAGALPGELPAFTRVETWARPVLPSGTPTGDFNGDGEPDALRFGESSRTDVPGVVSRLVYADLHGENGPAQAESDGSSWNILPSGNGPHNGRVLTGPNARLSFSLFYDDDAGSSLDRISVFIDANRNGRLDAADLTITERYAPHSTHARGQEWRFTTFRKEWWGEGLATVFVVAADVNGVIATPLTGRVWLG